MTLEDTLAELDRYCDKIVLSSTASLGWRCYGDLRIRVTGGNFTIESGARHGSPLPAAQQMLERVLGCLKDVHKLAGATPYKAPALEHRQ